MSSHLLFSIAARLTHHFPLIRQALPREEENHWPRSKDSNLQPMKETRCRMGQIVTHLATTMISTRTYSTLSTTCNQFQMFPQVRISQALLEGQSRMATSLSER